jgi:hypothetical protein
LNHCLQVRVSGVVEVHGHSLDIAYDQLLPNRFPDGGPHVPQHIKAGVFSAAGEVVQAIDADQL